MKKKKTALMMAAVMTVSLLAACGQGGQQQAKTGSAPAVSVVTIEPQKLTLSTLLPGRTAPRRIAEIRPQVNGLIQRRLFKNAH